MGVDFDFGASLYQTGYPYQAPINHNNVDLNPAVLSYFFLVDYYVQSDEHEHDND